MRDADKTKKQLLEELRELRMQNTVLRESGSKEERMEPEKADPLCPNGKRSGQINEDSRMEHLLCARFRLVQFALSHSLGELLKASLDEVEALTGSTIGFYHFLEEDQRTLSLRAWSTNTLQKMCNARGKGRHYDIAEAGVWVDCIRQRRPVIHNDYPALKERKGLPPGHADVIRELVVPVFRGDRIMAIVGVGNKPHEYDDSDVEAVSLMADLAWDIVESKKAGETFRESEEKYRSVVENIGIGIALISPAMEILSLNRQMGKWFPDIDISAKPLCYKVYNNPPRETVCSYCPTVQTLKDGQVHEAITDTPAGNRTIHYRIISSPIMDKDGRIAAAVEMVDDITERKTIEEALRISEARFNEAQHIAHIGNWEWDTLTNNVYWSDELYRIYGYQPHEISPDYGLIVAAMHPDSRQEFLEAIAAALKGQRPFEMDYTFFRKDGSEAVLHTIGKVLYDSEGAERMAGTVQDITEHKRAQEAMRESEEKFRSIFDKANDGILIADISTKKFTLANRKICDMLGYPMEEMLNLSIEDIHPPVDLPRVLAEFDKQTKGETAVAANLPVMRRDGSIFYADIGTTIITLKGERCAIGIFHDITQRMKMEEALRSSRAFIENVLDTVDEAFIVIDKDYRIIMANNAYGKQENLPVRDIVGRRCFEISHGSDKPCYERGEECVVRHSFEEGQPHACIHKHYNNGGDVIYVETKSYPLRDVSGMVTSVIEVIKNITDKHLLEEQLLRTQKLEAVGLLAGGIAHDFNNLLQGVFGSISVAKMISDKEGKVSEMLEGAEAALHQARNLTKQLLTFSKGGEPVKRVVALPSVIHSAVKFALSGSNVNYIASIDDNLRLVEADEGQINQVMHNIVLNAVEAMPDGGTIRIAVKNVTVDGQSSLSLRKGDYVQIAIEDSGTGIPDSHISRIFDPYFTTKRKGSGLGLTTSYSIVKKHDGLMDVESHLGRGSTFFIYLPASGERLLSQAQEQQKALLPGKGRILVMDDEEVVRTIAGLMVEGLGYEVDLAKNGEEATEKYSDALKAGHPFDAVILDLTVRCGMGGRETIRKMAEMDSEVLAIVSSGYSADTIVADYRQYGFKAVLSKPYAIEELGRVLHSLIKTENT
jgi:two-component system cell cycle sensor histidine kinase/response regulator CckA